jgi:hypothetical protein
VQEKKDLYRVNYSRAEREKYKEKIHLILIIRGTEQRLSQTLLVRI